MHTHGMNRLDCINNLSVLIARENGSLKNHLQPPSLGPLEPVNILSNMQRDFENLVKFRDLEMTLDYQVGSIQFHESLK